MKDFAWILLRLGEIALKGRNRRRFESTVINHLRAALKSYRRVEITRTFGRIYVELNGESYPEISERIAKVFGIVSHSPVCKTEHDLQKIRDTAVYVMESLADIPQTFKVSVKRAFKSFPYDSQEMNDLIGGYVLQHFPGLKVDVHHPEKELRVEIRAEGVFVYCDVVPGMGGYPIGSNGKAMLMLSGGIDSPVAGFLSMRRGLKIEAVHFHSFPFTSERAQQKVIDLTEKLSVYSGKMTLHMVPFTEIQTKLRQDCQENLLITLMRRAMFRITEKLALQQGAQAIVTGESLGQVASQTLPSLNAIGRVVDLPILRPLIAMDKNEIIRVAEKIETYSTSILPFEDCCTLFVPKSPSTNPNLRILEKIENQLSWLPEFIDEAVEKTETIRIEKKLEPETHHLF